MIPVNPGPGRQGSAGQTVYAKLADIPEPVDMVDIFRASQHALPIVKEALAMKPRPGVIWMQLGVRNDEAAKLAEAAGIKVVMNRCPKIEYGRLSSEISWLGVNSRTISSKRGQIAKGGIQRLSLNRTTIAGRRNAGRHACAERQRLIPPLLLRLSPVHDASDLSPGLTAALHSPLWGMPEHRTAS